MRGIEEKQENDPENESELKKRVHRIRDKVVEIKDGKEIIAFEFLASLKRRNDNGTVTNI